MQSRRRSRDANDLPDRWAFNSARPLKDGVTNGYTSGGRGRGVADGAEGRAGMLTPGVPGKHTRTLRRLTQRLQQGAGANASAL